MESQTLQLTSASAGTVGDEDMEVMTAEALN